MNTVATAVRLHAGEGGTGCKAPERRRRLVPSVGNVLYHVIQRFSLCRLSDSKSILKNDSLGIPVIVLNVPSILCQLMSALNPVSLYRLQQKQSRFVKLLSAKYIIII